MDAYTLLRRLRAGESNSGIARMLHLNRKTVRKYRAWAEAQGLLEKPLPELVELEAQLRETYERPARRGKVSTVEPWRDEIEALLKQGLRPKLIFEKLSEHPDFTGSKSAVWRLTRKLRPAKPQAIVRVETPPGEEAQVDFGMVPRMYDPVSGKIRNTWVFVMLLSWSRHMYVEFVFDQRIETWLELHRRAFEFFGGVPKRLVIDNLKAGIVSASFDKPQVQRAYAECAEHYGFLIAPCRPRTPQHKGKVERGGVGYVKSSFVPLLPVSYSVPRANERVRRWLLTTAGNRKHGTTQVEPLVRFTETERAALQPLPAMPHDPAICLVPWVRGHGRNKPSCIETATSCSRSLSTRHPFGWSARSSPVASTGRGGFGPARVKSAYLRLILSLPSPVAYSGEDDHRIRAMPITCSGACRSPRPEHGDRLGTQRRWWKHHTLSLLTKTVGNGLCASILLSVVDDKRCVLGGPG